MGIRSRIALTVLVVSATLYSVLATVGFVQLASNGRSAIRERVEQVLDQLEAGLRAGGTGVTIRTPDGVVATATAQPVDVAVGSDVVVVSRVITVGEWELVLTGRAPADRLTDSLRRFHRTLWTAVVLGVLITTGATWLALRRALTPVAQITALAAGIGASQLSDRVPIPGADDEIATLARTVNEMLDRIEAGHVAQRRFTSDAAHELRTPLMALLGELELARRLPDEAPPLDRLEAQCHRLSQRVDDLVLLSTLDEAPPLRRDAIDLTEALQDELGPDIEVAGPPLPVRVDERLLRRAVTNLVANARRHARATVRVQVVTAHAPSGGDAVWIHVDDDGPGIDAEHRDRVFRRFDRLDDGRSADSGGSGLGLAIVASVAASHGGGAQITESPLGGARVSLWLPASVRGAQATTAAPTAPEQV